jgi:thymidylate kinase
MAVPQKGLFIAFEGLDGSGKTTLAKLFAQRNNGVYQYPAETYTSAIRPQVRASSMAARFFYYLLGNVMVSQEAEKILPQQNLVVDRHVWSTFAYHPVFEMNEDFLRYVREPDLWVLLEADPEDIEKRIAEKGRTASEDPERLKQVRNWFAVNVEEKDNVLRINTSHVGIEDAIKLIEEKLS